MEYGDHRELVTITKKWDRYHMYVDTAMTNNLQQASRVYMW
jgi:hypothetical protein